MLLVTGIALAVLSGCHLEAQDESAAEPPVMGQARSALVTTVYDFIANAPGAAWSNNDGGLSWGTNDSRGTCLAVPSSVAENNGTYQVLATFPKNAPNGFMRGSYSVTIPAAALHPTATATFGFAQGAGGGDGVTFSMKTLINGSWVTLFSQTKTYTGALATKTADLSAYAGQTLQIFLGTDAGATATSDLVGWMDARITVDGSAPPITNGCTIGGVQYADGAVNPAVSCQVCDPVESTSAWSIRADSCRIGGTCYAADEQDPLGCRRCDPLTSQTAWTNQTQCDKLVIATTTTTTNGAFGGYANADTACANGGATLGLPGNWRAVLFDWDHELPDTVSSYDSTRPVVNLNGQQLYSTWSSIFTNQVWPAGLSIYAFGTSPTSVVGSAYTGTVWSGTDPSGQATGGNCDQGTGQGPWRALSWLGTGIDPYYASVGDFSQRKLLNGGTQQLCSGQKRFACVLTPIPGQVTIENYDGTALGTIQGKPHNDAYAWQGIPYAASPTGSRRLAPPAKATSWTGVRNAFNQPSPCPQPPLLPLGGMIGSEDCLYLNVWAPKSATPTSNLPVLVFQHGGAHTFGGTKSSDDWLATGFIDGDRFVAAQNAVVVTIQTRLGPLGYLTDAALAANSTSRTSSVGGGTSGNYGLLDNVQALKWIKRNISKFGGDPNKVAFAGESSGATHVCDLLASPLNKDPADNKPYFSSAIMESGFCEQPSVAYRQAQATPAIAGIGCGSATDKVACLRAASVQSFVNQEGTILGVFPDLFASATPPEHTFGLMWGPHIDGYVLPQQPRVSFAAGTHNKMPVIVGNNKEEGMFFMLFMVGGILTGDLPNLIVLAGCSARDAKVNINLGTTLGNAVKSLYPCNGLDLLSPTKTYSAGVTHLQYECPARRTARALDLGQTQAVRRYWFTHRADRPGILQNLFFLIRDIGAAHTFEMPYIFNTHNTVLGYWPSSREKSLGSAMQKYWRAFAATGDPNYPGSVNWTAYAIASDNTLQLEVGSGLQMVNGINTDKCDFWDNNFTLDGWK